MSDAPVNGHTNCQQHQHIHTNPFQSQSKRFALEIGLSICLFFRWFQFDLFIMAMNKFMHSKNVYNTPANFAQLAEEFEDFRAIAKTVNEHNSLE